MSMSVHYCNSNPERTMNTDTPRTNRFYASFADGECIPNQDELLALCESLKSELTAVTEQRDRLAEILENSLSSFKITQVPKDYPANHWSNKAILELQSLKPSNDL